MTMFPLLGNISHYLNIAQYYISKNPLHSTSIPQRITVVKNRIESSIPHDELLQNLRVERTHRVVGDLAKRLINLITKLDTTKFEKVGVVDICKLVHESGVIFDTQYDVSVEAIEEGKIYVLAQLVLFLDHYLLSLLLSISLPIEDYLRYWKTRKNSMAYWYLTEKTPWFWFTYYTQMGFIVRGNLLKYLFRKGDTFNVGIKHTNVQHPSIELNHTIHNLNNFDSWCAMSIGLITYSLNRIGGDTNEIRDRLEDNLSVIKEIITEFNIQSGLENNSTSVNNNSDNSNNSNNNSNSGESSGNENQNTQTYSRSLSNLMTQLSDLNTNVHLYLKQYRPPNFFVRNWMKITLGGFVVYFSVKHLKNHRVDIYDYIEGTKQAMLRFWKEHLEEPLTNIWSVIRYDKKTLSVVDPASLEQSVESLGRMVKEYAIDSHNKNLTPIDLDNIYKSALNGNIGVVMNDYENAIKSPIKNVILGDMLRLMLIQIQKQKVDLERAMSALDRLLQSNELNFQMLATIPAILLITFILFQMPRFFPHSDPKLAIHQDIRMTLRNLERLLNQAQSTYVGDKLTKSVDYMSNNNNINTNSNTNNNNNNNNRIEPFVGGVHAIYFGYLVRYTCRLQKLSSLLSNSQDRVWFSEDLLEIESENTVPQKLLTISRMYNTYHFLSFKK